MTRVLTMALALLFLSYASGTTPARAQHPKHEHKAAHAAHSKPKTEHAHTKAHAEHAKKEAHTAGKHEPKNEKRAGKHEPKSKEHRKEAEKKHQHTSQEKRLIETLHRVVANLHRADHDYHDQRHEALERVRAALGDLHAPDPGATGRFGDMTQAKSNAILREQLGPLQTVRSELSAKGAPAHHGAAVRKIDEAIAKIHDALKKR